MILTAAAIRQAWQVRDITIDPFQESLLNPNSYNYRLSKTLVRVTGNEGDKESVDCIEMSDNGFVLQPKTLYLGATHEVIGSRKYVMTLSGRSSVGRLGLFLDITADLGHAGSVSQWTLELKVVQPLRIYPHMRIGQVAFWCQRGSPLSYEGRYHRDLGPVANRDPRLEGCLPDESYMEKSA